MDSFNNPQFFEPKRKAPGPPRSGKTNLAFRWLKARFKLRGRARQREHDETLAAARISEEIARKFQRLDTRQQRRYAAFQAAYAKASEKLNLPRRARRKIARVWAKKSIHGEAIAA